MNIFVSSQREIYVFNRRHETGHDILKLLQPLLNLLLRIRLVVIISLSEIANLPTINVATPNSVIIVEEFYIHFDQRLNLSRNLFLQYYEHIIVVVQFCFATTNNVVIREVINEIFCLATPDLFN